MTQTTATINAGRIALVPLAPESARAILDGDLSGWTPAEGWPHKDTADGLRGVTGGSLGWLVTLDGAVIGDCGTLGGVRPSGDIEIGYGLAAPYRGQGYGTELVRALAGWLRARPGVRRVVAGTLPDNIASRRVLEHAGFTEDGVEAGEVRYALSSLGSTDE